jgi:hypothetical protein
MSLDLQLVELGYAFHDNSDVWWKLGDTAVDKVLHDVHPHGGDEARHVLC